MNVCRLCCASVLSSNNLISHNTPLCLNVGMLPYTHTHTHTHARLLSLWKWKACIVCECWGWMRADLRLWCHMRKTNQFWLAFSVCWCSYSEPRQCVCVLYLTHIKSPGLLDVKLDLTCVPSDVYFWILAHGLLNRTSVIGSWSSHSRASVLWLAEDWC